ncbi:MAG TPA: SigB/SigF/SigG family RNA polymerase sigma factor [Solirubrobacteraceae bacterium]|nr:SigB/SigF/SigG family RNA polymerase sigma factor [Solirubrobacteraceae bacterium]
MSTSQLAREDARLFARYRRTGNQDAREELVERFLPLARRLAARYREGHEYDDLVQVASLALIKAIDRYDPGRGLAFSSYAVPTIVGELKRYFRDYTWTVRVPRDLQELALKVQRASAQLTTRLGRSPTAAEIAEALDSSVELVLEALQTGSAHTPDSLDAPADVDDDERPALTAASVETGYELADAAASLAPLLARLTARDRQIVSLRFEHDLTQSEIGARLGLSQMHVSRILRKAIAELHRLATEA